MAGRKKTDIKDLTHDDIDSHIDTFLAEGGEIIEIPRGKSGFFTPKNTPKPASTDTETTIK